MMNCFTGYEYLQIDVANCFGLDKENYDVRIQWVQDNMANLESLVDVSDDPPMYHKAVSALRKVQRGEPTGHLVGFDAAASGPQIMSALMNCQSGAKATGLIDTGNRPDLYSAIRNVMQKKLGETVEVTRQQLKDAVMPFFYGSRAEPIKVFGEDTPELECFYEALAETCPGAYGLMTQLLESWDRNALAHSWVLPDGFHVYNPVLYATDKEIKIDDLGGVQFTHRYKENISTAEKERILKKRNPRAFLPNERKNAANVVHSIDALVCREIVRRCSYDEELLLQAKGYLELYFEMNEVDEPTTLDYTDFVSFRMAEELALRPELIKRMTDNQKWILLDLIIKSLAWKPFPVVTIHDDFKCHPNNMNVLRKHYNEILAQLNGSHLIEDILNQLTNNGETFITDKPFMDLARASNYALS